MPTPDSLPSAQEYMKRLALVEVQKASEQAKKQADAEAARKALLDHLTHPSGISDEEAIQRAITVIERAVSNRLSRIQVCRFPNDICTDGGRAINQHETGWESTLTGVPQEIYRIWEKYFREKGYGLTVEIVDYPGGKPGDVVMTLTWG